MKKLAFGIALVFSWQAMAAGSYSTADLYFTVSADGKTIYDDARHVLIKDAKQLTKLAAFFRGKERDEDERPSKSPSWGWVCFHSKGAKDVTFAFTLDGKLFTRPDKDGTWSARPGLRAFLARYLKT